MEYKDEKKSSQLSLSKAQDKWRTAYFTFDEMTCSLFRYDKPGSDAMDIYEVGGVVQRANRLFKRKNRFDVVLLDRTVMAFAATTPEICDQFVTNITAICSPTNSAALRQLRTEFTAESRKVISLTSSVEIWRTKFGEANRLYAVADSGVKASRKRSAIDRVIAVFRRYSSVASAFEMLYANSQHEKLLEHNRRIVTLSCLQNVVNTWTNRVLMVHFIKWVRFCVVDNVKNKVSAAERAETIKAVKQKLTGTGMFLDLIGEIRRTEIRVMEAELDALDAREQLERAQAAGGLARGGGNMGGGATLDLLRRMEAVYEEVVGDATLLGPTIPPTSPIPREEENFGPVGAATPDIHMNLNASYELDKYMEDGGGGGDGGDSSSSNKHGNRGAMLLEATDDDTDDSHLSHVPQQVKRIERRLSSGGMGFVSPIKK